MLARRAFRFAIAAWLCALAVAFAAPARKPVTRQLTPLELEDLLAHDRLMTQAVLHRDLAFLQSHIAPDAIYIIKGKQYTRRMYLALVAELPVVTSRIKVRYPDAHATMTGDVVELTVTAIASIQSNGQWNDLVEGRSTLRFRQVNDEWIGLGGREIYTKRLLPSAGR